jgi:adenosylhomocysteine nucleosidase
MSGQEGTAPLIVTGMAMEAALLGGSVARVIIGAGDFLSLERKISAELARRPAPVLSFGIAGGLDPRLSVGDCVIPDLISTAVESFVCDEGWVERLRTATAALAGNATRRRALAGQDMPVASSTDKAALYLASGAVAVDMESHIAARVASRHALPFAALRIVSDPAGRDLPPAALVRMRPDGNPHIAEILRSLARRPGQIGALITLSRDLNVAMRALRSARARLGESFAYSAAT